ncbi:MAG TPA: aldehyde dehydrogenase [Saprospiraceae bacterium]|nr:aldehyde dehydrogenase [Saprospiraceae bacterium]
MKQYNHFINGEYRPSLHGGTMDIINPATGQKYATLASGDEADVKLAYTAANNAAETWACTPLPERQRILQKIASLIEERSEQFAEAEMLDTGKPISLARRLDIPRAASNFSFFAAAASQLASESHYMPGQALNYTLRQPIGVVGCISPWNLPLYLFTWKIAPALAAGNTVVSKPSELTPVTAAMLGDICNEAGLPAGVLNIIHGTGPTVGEAIVRHEGIKAISFTGSTTVGKRIAGICAEQLKKSSLELGGKNPVIIFADCDYEEMLETTIRSSFSNQGQICLCGSRILVQKSIYEKFVADFTRRVKAMKLGDPSSPDTEVGALISEGHLQKVLSYIDLAQMEGGRIECGGKQVQMPAPNEGGFFVEPTIITGLIQNCRTNQEEIFGPVVTIMPFESEMEAIALANQTSYGLASVVWTNHLARAHRIAGALQTGIVWINCWLLRDLRTPFGGVKQSGIGREGGWEAIRFFTEAKNVTIKYEH